MKLQKFSIVSGEELRLFPEELSPRQLAAVREFFAHEREPFMLTFAVVDGVATVRGEWATHPLTRAEARGMGVVLTGPTVEQDFYESCGVLMQDVIAYCEGSYALGENPLPCLRKKFPGIDWVFWSDASQIDTPDDGRPTAVVFYGWNSLEFPAGKPGGKEFFFTFFPGKPGKKGRKPVTAPVTADENPAETEINIDDLDFNE